MVTNHNLERFLVFQEDFSGLEVPVHVSQFVELSAHSSIRRRTEAAATSFHTVGTLPVNPILRLRSMASQLLLLLNSERLGVLEVRVAGEHVSQARFTITTGTYVIQLQQYVRLTLDVRHLTVE